jgi:lipid-A-disaccharide synthase
MSEAGADGQENMSTAATRDMVPAEDVRDLSLFVIAGEHSGDALGAKLVAALKAARRGRVRFLGVGGPLLAAEGLVPQFPLDDVAVMGPGAILARLPLILRRIRGTARAAVAAEPDAVVIIDSPEFTHPIARRIRRYRPDIPIVDYVSPSVWAWRPGRARKMRAYVDHVLALWPFEPEVHRRLDGPACSFVGHPLIERHAWIKSLDPAPLAQRLGLAGDAALVVVLPGSRTSEVSRMMQPFGETLARLQREGRKLEAVLPVVASVRPLVERHVRDWPVRPHLVGGEEDKFRAFRLARGALAASGTVTLELGLVGTPMVVAYKVGAVAAPVLRRVIKAPSTVLPNLVLGRNVVPEFHQEQCTPAKLARALAGALDEGPVRAKQLDALAQIPGALQAADRMPSEAAARIVLDYAENGRGWPRPRQA